MPLKSRYPDVEIPDVDIWTFLFERKTKDFTDSKEIFTDSATDRTYTFGDLRSAAVQFGRGLRALWDWKRGDVLNFYTPNSVDTPALMMGLIWAGGVASPANPLYTEAELTYQLRDCGAKAIVTQLANLDTARRAAHNVGIPEDRIILLGDVHDPTGTFRHFTAIRSAPHHGRITRPHIDPRNDLAWLVYSSGTTGLPKGVCLTHRNSVANMMQILHIDAALFQPYGGFDGKGDRSLGIAPFFHIYGLAVTILVFVMKGWELIIMERFDIERACQLIEKHRISLIYVPPPVILAFAKHPCVDKYDLTSLRVFSSGAAPLSQELTLALWDRLKIVVKQGYGLSETSPCSHNQHPDDWAKFMGSVGKLVPNMEAKVVDPETEEEVPEGVPGELWLKGPNIFAGYLNLPDNTQATMSPCGYFKTGDIMTYDKHGNFYCVDRLKELIKYKGFQVPPAELEGLLLDHPDVLDVGVIGVEDRSQATEVPRAYVVLKPGVPRETAKAQEIVDWLGKQVAPHKKLRGGVHFIDAVPKSASGKILRRFLRDQARQEERATDSKL